MLSQATRTRRDASKLDMAPPLHTNDKDREEQDITLIKEIIKQVIEDLETGKKRKAKIAMNSL
jgi:hypothetical protein